jgi:hypothetical protein
LSAFVESVRYYGKLRHPADLTLPLDEAKEKAYNVALGG